VAAAGFHFVGCVVVSVSRAAAFTTTLSQRESLFPSGLFRFGPMRKIPDAKIFDFVFARTELLAWKKILNRVE
jgi:hypothetical protein